MTGTDNEAVTSGYTRAVQIEIGDNSLVALIRPDTDLDSTFKAFDTDNQEWLNVNGWLISDVEDLI